MLLKEKKSGGLIEVAKFEEVWDPNQDTVEGKLQEGQNEQNSTSYKKEDLIFPSGEKLPLCWLDPDYRTNSSPQ